MKFFLLPFTFLFCLTLFAQKQDSSPIRPLLLDKSVLSGVGLDTIHMKNTPERDFFQKRLYRGEEISIYVVSSETWSAPFDAFWFDEFIHILHGGARVKHEDSYTSLESGEYVFAPSGFPGEWEVEAGENYHYELSVITNRRADSTAVSDLKQPISFSSRDLSGRDIVLKDTEVYEKILARGIELTCVLRAEKPQERLLTDPSKEQMIKVLSGQLTFTDSTGESTTFYTGDFFVLPTGFKGIQLSRGHSIVKYLSVFSSEL